MRIFDLLDRTAIDPRAEAILAASLYMTPDCWAAERDLAQTKWFDYRSLSPIQATLFFVEEYQRIFRWKWGQSFDSSEADKKRGIAIGGFFHSRKEFSAFWTARAHADWLGVSDEIYISTAMKTALRRAKQPRFTIAFDARQGGLCEFGEQRALRPPNSDFRAFALEPIGWRKSVRVLKQTI